MIRTYRFYSRRDPANLILERHLNRIMQEFVLPVLCERNASYLPNALEVFGKRHIELMKNRILKKAGDQKSHRLSFQEAYLLFFCIEEAESIFDFDLNFGVFSGKTDESVRLIMKWCLNPVYQNSVFQSIPGRPIPDASDIFQKRHPEYRLKNPDRQGILALETPYRLFYLLVGPMRYYTISFLERARKGRRNLYLEVLS